MHEPLSENVESRLKLVFSGKELTQAQGMLEADCARNIAGWKMAGLDRLRLALVKLSGGSLSRLAEAIELAQTDFRDALVAAGFADDPRAHENWWPE